MRIAQVITTAALLFTPTLSVAQDPYPQISIIVGFSPGGGYDTYARVLSRHYGRNLPGYPRIIVQNMPGASSLTAVRYLDNAGKKDGSVITAFNPGLINQSLLEYDKVKVRFPDYAWIGSITKDYRVCYAWNAGGVRSWDDLLKRDRFNLGTTAPGASAYINHAIMKNLFGVKVHHVTGYPGSAEERLAIERGELDGGCGAWSSNPPQWIKDKKISALVAFTKPPIPNLDGDVPFVVDLAKTPDDKTLLNVLISPDDLGRPFIASREIPVERLATLRKGFDATMADTEFLAEAQKLDLTISPISGAEAEKMIGDIYRVPEHIIARARDIVK